MYSYLLESDARYELMLHTDTQEYDWITENKLIKAILKKNCLYHCNLSIDSN